MTRVAVVGHVEWIEFVRVPKLPAPGEIVEAPEHWEEVGGGGAVAAVQLAKLAGGCDFFTALADDPVGRRSHERLEALGVTVHAAWREGDQRRGFTHIDGDGRADDHRVRRADRAPRRRRAPVGAARPTPTASTSRAATPPRCAPRGAEGRWWPRRAAATRWWPPACGSTRWCAAPATPGEQLDPAASTRRPTRSSPPRARRRAWERPRGARALGRGAAARARRATPTVPATRSPPPSRSGSGTGAALQGALELAARAGAYKLAGRAPYDGQLTAAELSGP